MKISNYVHINRCPQCESKLYAKSVKLSNSCYWINHKRIPFPEDGIFINICAKCGLAFKNYWLSSSNLNKLNKDRFNVTWRKKRRSDFSFYHLVISSLSSEKILSPLLDLGSGSGSITDFLSTHGYSCYTHDLPFASVSSGKHHFSCYIDELPNKTGKLRFPLITAFDVLEHLTDPVSDFKSIANTMTNNGFFIAETGVLSSNDNLSTWWYMRLPEHNISWNISSLKYVSKQAQIALVASIPVKHKSRNNSSSTYQFKQIVIISAVGLISRSKFLLSLVNSILKQDITRLGTLKTDHILSIFQKR